MSLWAQLAAVHGTMRYNRDWPRYILSRLTAHGDDDRLTFRLRSGQTVALRATMRPTLNEIFLHHVYDVAGVDWSACRQIFDLGANMGVFPLYLAGRAPQATVHCFEPASSNRPWLEENLRVNGLAARVYPLAVSTACGSRPFYLGGEPGEYTLTPQPGPTEMVACVDLAQAFHLTGTPACDFLKMDVEGEEGPILEETPLSVLQRIGAMAVEWHLGQDRLQAVCTRLRAAGFEAWAWAFGREVILQARRLS